MVKRFFSAFFLALQLENYHIIRYLRTLYFSGFLYKSTYRQHIDWTRKMSAIALLSSFTIVLFLIVSRFVFGWIGCIVAVFVVLLLFPFFVSLIVLFLIPLDWLIKYRIIKRAQKKLGQYSHLTIIAITGSYGKTSQKVILGHILSSQYRVLIPAENYNTPMGVAKTILDNDLTQYDVFLVEMGAYAPGDIKELCELVHPSIGIITGITKQHLDRFGSLETIARTKRELGEYIVNQQGKLYVNIIRAETKNVLLPLIFSSIHPYITFLDEIGEVSYRKGFKGVSFVLDGQKCQLPLLAKHPAEYAIVAYRVGQELGISPSVMIESMSTLPHIPHRLEPIFNNRTGVIVIDDSYNGNIAGVHATIELMKSQVVTGKKIYITPGIVELGGESEKVHFSLGKDLADVFDLFLLVKTQGTIALSKGLLAAGVEVNNIMFFDTADDVHKSLGNFVKSGDCVVFQNDATDNYY